MFTRKNILSSCVNWRKGKEAVFTVGDFSPKCIVKFQSYKRWEEKNLYIHSEQTQSQMQSGITNTDEKKKCWRKGTTSTAPPSSTSATLSGRWAELWAMWLVRTHSPCSRCNPWQKRAWGAQLDFPEGFPWLQCEWGQGRCHRSFPHALALHKTLPNGN